jgi:hypothetical protein
MRRLSEVCSRGTSLVEVLFAFVATGVLIALAGCVFGLGGRPTDSRSAAQDAARLRDIHRGLIMAGAGGPDTFILPSYWDRANATLNTPGPAKDTTSHILSMLIYNGHISPKTCVSVAETNPAIREYSDYHYTSPPAAAEPFMALWDPAFSADFTAASGGSVSFAHSLPSPSRRASWANTFSAIDPILANRAPRIDGVEFDDGVPRAVLPPSSNTYRIHGGPTTWEGYVVFQDNHIRYTSRMFGKGTYAHRDGRHTLDNFFFNEPDDPEDTNDMLGIFTQSGPTTSDFHAIWD